MGVLTNKLFMNFSVWGFEHTNAVGSTKARKAISDRYKNSGGRPTPELERVYGEYLKYKREKSVKGQG